MNIVRRLRSALEGAAPAACMAVTLGAAAWIHAGGDHRGPIGGFAQISPEAIGPTEIARVKSIEVNVGDQVAPGQIVATLDTADIDAEIAVAEAEQARIEAEVRADHAELAQRLEVDVEALERELAQQREEQRLASAESAALEGEVSRVKQRVENQLAVVGDLTELDLKHATVKALAAEKPRTIGLLTRQLEAAKHRREETNGGQSAVAAKLTAELGLARRNTELLQQRKSRYVLRAAHGGRVAGIDRQVGEIVPAGEPVVRLASAVGTVIACVPENAALGLRDGDSARAWPRGQRGAPLTGRIAALGPVVSELPMRCWSSPKLPMWGREVTIALDDAVELLAGQPFDIAFQPGSAAPAAAPPPAAAPAAAATTAKPATPPAAGGAQPMRVPPELGRRTRLEPSGILARAGERRYLVVSDDTGTEDSEGVPWLFAMSSLGALEPAPVVVEGVKELSDVEAITAGDAGEIYLLSSQSYSKKGKRKPARTALLRVRKEGQGLRVDGEAHLAELLDAAPDRAAALGLPGGTGALDIEGMAFRDGALYVGLKAPLDAQGRAMIWKIAAPGALFEAGGAGARGRGDAGGGKRLDAAGISLWARASVDVEVAGQRTPGGISDLLFLPDGSLAIASTPSTAEGDAGALWRVDQPVPGELSPRLVQRFPGLKPEGIAPSLSPGKLVVVFDAGSAAPSFLELAWGP